MTALKIPVTEKNPRIGKQSFTNGWVEIGWVSLLATKVIRIFISSAARKSPIRRCSYVASMNITRLFIRKVYEVLIIGYERLRTVMCVYIL